MKPPLVSVVMPTYNAGKYVEEAISSILGQTFSDFEFIIVDDGSTDRTPEILRTYTDPRIQLLFNEKNEGNYPARNRGCRLARGKYIAVMDGDDVAMPERLEKQVKFMEENPDFFLQNLVAYLRATASYVSQGGLYNGRLGIILFFYLYARYKQETEYHKIADQMLEKVLNELKDDMPVDLNYGVCGAHPMQERIVR